MIAYVNQEPNHRLDVRSEMEALSGVDDVFIYHPNSTHAVRLDGGDPLRPRYGFSNRSHVSILVADRDQRDVAAVTLDQRGGRYGYVRSGYAYMLVRPRAGAQEEYEPDPGASGVLLFAARS